MTGHFYDVQSLLFFNNKKKFLQRSPPDVYKRQGLMLTIENLTMKFGGVTALDNISMHVAPGTIHGIIGPNGSGKTTLFNCVSGIYKPTSGKIIFNGNQDITGMEPHKVTKSGIARTFQMLRIFPSLSVLDNLILAQALFEKSTMPVSYTHLL